MRIEIVIDRCTQIGGHLRFAADESETSVADHDDRGVEERERSHGAGAQCATAKGRGDLREIADQQCQCYVSRARNIAVIGCSFASCSASSITICCIVSSIDCSLLRAARRSIFRSWIARSRSPTRDIACEVSRSESSSASFTISSASLWALALTSSETFCAESSVSL